MQENQKYGPLELLTTEEITTKFNMRVDWLAKNRMKGDNRIPFRRFGRYIRYQRNDLAAWLGYEDNQTNGDNS